MHPWRWNCKLYTCRISSKFDATSLGQSLCHVPFTNSWKISTKGCHSRSWRTERRRIFHEKLHALTRFSDRFYCPLLPKIFPCTSFCCVLRLLPFLALFLHLLGNAAATGFFFATCSFYQCVLLSLDLKLHFLYILVISEQYILGIIHQSFS